MSVSIADISVATTIGASVSTITTPAMTVTNNANRAGLIGVAWGANSMTGITGDIGGTAGSVVTGTDSTTAKGYRTLMIGVTAPPNGSQTATVSWTGATSVMIGAVATSGVDQTTPFNNGTFASGSDGLPTLTITSTSGDLTSDVETNSANSHADTTNQTLQWSQGTTGFSGGGGSGPGSGNTTHTWTIGAGTWIQSGANFNQLAAVPDSIGAANITSSAGRFIGWTV